MKERGEKKDTTLERMRDNVRETERHSRDPVRSVRLDHQSNPFDPNPLKVSYNLSQEREIDRKRNRVSEFIQTLVPLR